MSSNLGEADVRRAVALISSDRLATFMRIAGTEQDALTLHEQAMRVGAALMPAIGMLEIALRNAIAERLRTMFGVPDWLTQPPPPFEWREDEANGIKMGLRHAQRAVYGKLSQMDKRALDVVAFPNGVPQNIGHERRSKSRQSKIQVTNGQLIAQLTIFFWKRLFSSDYEATLWKRDLRKLFPKKHINRTDISIHLEMIYECRNRIAHHEPVMSERLENVIASIDFISENFDRRGDEVAILEEMLRPFMNLVRSEAAALNSMIEQLTIPAEGASS